MTKKNITKKNTEKSQNTPTKVQKCPQKNQNGIEMSIITLFDDERAKRVRTRSDARRA
jgi:hypothetical protein